jgi:hypothetical protein
MLLTKFSEILGGIIVSEKKVVHAVKVGPTTTGKMRWSIMCLSPDGAKTWYSTFSPAIGRPVESIKEGDTVDLTYVQSGQYFNITKIEKIASATPAVSEPGLPEDDQPKTKSDYHQRQLAIVIQTSIERAISLLPYVYGLVPDAGIPLHELMEKVQSLANSLNEYVWTKINEEEKESEATPSVETPA